jgi:chitinase
MKHVPARRILLCAALGLAALLVAPTAANAVGETAAFTKVQDWGTGWEGKYTITNGPSAITSWRVEFDLPTGTTITTNWDSVRSGSGNHVIFSNASWNGSLGAGASVSFGFNGAGPGTPTNCTVNGQNCGGGGGPGVPGAPGSPSVTNVTASSISLSWGASSGTVTGYRVFEGSTVVATPTGTTATIGSLAAGSTHTYTVAAFNSAGESPRSASVTGTTSSGTGVPGAPGNLGVTGTSSSSISLSWNASSGTVTGYRVFEGSTVVATPTGTTATIGSLAACSTHSYTVAAFNSTGESARSASVTGTTTGCNTGPLPAHFLTGYWHNFNNGSAVLRLRDVPSEFDMVAVAFADATGTPGAVTFNIDAGLSSSLGGYTNADFAADVATMHSRGKKVIISVGGQNGTISVSDSNSANNFANSLRSLISQFGFDGVDIDLENGINAQFMGQALRSVRNSVGANFIITMAPQTIDMQSTGMAYFQLALNIKDILTVVHMQYYNSGSMLGCDQAQPYSQGSVNFMTALACIQLENGLRPDQVALGLPAGPGAAGGGVIAPSLVNDALNCLARGTNCGSFKPPRTYPGIRGAMTWSINWDVHDGNGFARTVRPFLNTLP